MHPILIQFYFPEFLGRIGWIEMLVTAVAVALLFLWRHGRPRHPRAPQKPRFSPAGFFLWLGVYAALRALVWYAGPGYHFKLHTYGVMIALGFVVAIYLGVRQARREFIDPNVVLDLAFWILISAMVGSRLLFILVNIEDYLANPMNFVKVWTGGLVFYGGFIGAVAASWYYCRKRGISFFRISDVFIPSVAMGHFFGRLGCFSAGCCHGCATGVDSFGVIFTAPGTVVKNSGLNGIPVHPTQLYDAFGELAFFTILILIRPGKRFNGQLLSLWLVLYPIWRFFGEMFRGDKERGTLFQIDLWGDSTPELLSTSQLVSIGLVALGIVLWVILRKRAHKEPPPPETPDTIDSPALG